MAKARRGGRSHVVDRRLPTGTERPFPRAARVNEALREVLAEAIERMADTDDRLALLTITAVQVEPDFARAVVLFASLSADARTALGEVRLRLQSAVARGVRLKRTPLLAFAIDPAVTTGQRVEEILRDIRKSGPEPSDEGVQDDH